MPAMRSASTSTSRRASYSSVSSYSRRASMTRLPLAPIAPHEMTHNFNQPPYESSSSSKLPRQRRSSKQSDDRRSSLPTSHPRQRTQPDLPAFDPRVHDNLLNFSFGTPLQPDKTGSSTDDTDEEERARLDRAKMRAIDDGSRRPSLPINIPRRDSAASRRKPSRHLDDDGDDIFMSVAKDSQRAHRRPQLTTSNAASGFDLAYILAGPSTYPPSNRSKDLDQHPLNDDTFAMFVHQFDPEYARRRAIWSFKPEHSSPPLTPKAREKSPEGSVPPEHPEAEIWNCDAIGKYCIWPNRQESTPESNPTRRPIVVRHLTDRREEERGPSVIIHKHSKVKAFSVFRGFHVPGMKIQATSAILVASKAVHNSDTANNGSTLAPSKFAIPAYERDPVVRKLNTYHHLDDVEDPTPRSPPPPTIDNTGTKRRRRPTRQLSLRSTKTSSKPLPLPEPQSIEAVSTHPAEDSVNDSPHSRKSHAIAFDALDPSLIDQVLSRASPASLGERLKRAFSTKQPPSAPQQTGPSSSSLDGSYCPPWMLLAPESIKQEEQRIIRSLNASFRAVGLIPPPKPKGSASTETRSKRHSGVPAGSSVRSAILDEIPDDALCMVLPLWPSDNGPPNDLDVESPPITYPTAPSERQYLLVYYVPFSDEAEAEGKGKSKESTSMATSKKRSRQQRQSPNPHISPSSPQFPPASQAKPPRTRTDLEKQCFRIVARMVTFAEVKECGMRLPKTGLSVTGVLSDALLGNPSYHASRPAFPTVIAVCHGRNKGVEFLPEGLDNLGLRHRNPLRISQKSLERRVSLTGAGSNLVVRTDSPRPGSSFSDTSLSEDLTMIGRAVVELAWSGCVALFEHGFA